MERKVVFTFDQLPHAMGLLFSEIQDIKNLLQSQQSPVELVKKPKNIKEAADFLELAVPTVYGLVSRGILPHFKKGKRLYFDEQILSDWIKSGRRNTHAEFEAEASQYISSKSQKKR